MNTYFVLVFQNVQGLFKGIIQPNCFYLWTFTRLQVIQDVDGFLIWSITSPIYPLQSMGAVRMRDQLRLIDGLGSCQLFVDYCNAV